MTKYKILFALCFVVLLIGIGSSSLGTYKSGECVQIVNNLNATAVNISGITSPSPNSSILITNQAMTKDGSFFNYTFCDTSKLGIYTYGFCDSNGYCFNNDFEITATGSSLSTSKSITYILIFVFSLLIFIGLMIAGITIPSNNDSDQMTGYVIAVSNLKYLKLFCLALAYLVAIFIFFFSYNMSYAYLDMGFMTSIFQFMFYALLAALLPLFGVGIYVVLANLTRDAKIKEAMSRGFKIKE